MGSFDHFVVKARPNPYIPAQSRGWGNGYAVVPQGHWLSGMSYEVINRLLWDQFETGVNGGLTYSELAQRTDDPKHRGCWVVGFDTAHAWDTLESWPEKAVRAEAQRLANLLARLKLPAPVEPSQPPLEELCEECGKPQSRCLGHS